MPAAGAAVATHRDLQDRGSPPEGLMREPADDRVPRSALTAATTTPLIRGEDPTGEHGPIGLEALTGHDEIELIESAERGQVRTSAARPTGSVRHVEVFQMSGVGTFILTETSTPIQTPTRRRSSRPDYTLTRRFTDGEDAAVRAARLRRA
ncbi:hypothetical protein GCM10023350_30010 [Nocardioides endophyticus]|uniref:Uncharacterized protein n=1 Tax=Nocardioides endophyticus TaxID=1353775 RepID=A0ABP8Z0X9_9ACTN